MNDVAKQIADEVREALGSKVILVEPFESYDQEDNSYSPAVRVLIADDTDVRSIESTVLDILTPYVKNAAYNSIAIPTYDIVFVKNKDLDDSNIELSPLLNLQFSATENRDDAVLKTQPVKFEIKSIFNLLKIELVLIVLLIGGSILAWRLRSEVQELDSLQLKLQKLDKRLETLNKKLESRK